MMLSEDQEAFFMAAVLHRLRQHLEMTIISEPTPLDPHTTRVTASCHGRVQVEDQGMLITPNATDDEHMMRAVDHVARVMDRAIVVGVGDAAVRSLATPSERDGLRELIARMTKALRDTRGSTAVIIPQVKFGEAELDLLSRILTVMDKANEAPHAMPEPTKPAERPDAPVIPLIVPGA